MSRTYKHHKAKHKSKIKLSKKIKRESKEKRKALKDIDNPRLLKLKSADKWHYN